MCWWRRRLSHCCVKTNTGNDFTDLILKNTVKHTVTIAMLPYISPPFGLGLKQHIAWG